MATIAEQLAALPLIDGLSRNEPEAPLGVPWEKYAGGGFAEIGYLEKNWGYFPHLAASTAGAFHSTAALPTNAAASLELRQRTSTIVGAPRFELWMGIPNAATLTGVRLAAIQEEAAGNKFTVSLTLFTAGEAFVAGSVPGIEIDGSGTLAGGCIALVKLGNAYYVWTRKNTAAGFVKQLLEVGPGPTTGFPAIGCISATGVPFFPAVMNFRMGEIGVPLALSPATGESTSTLALTAKTAIPLETAAGTSGSTLALTAKTAIPLETAAGTSNSSLVLRARQRLQRIRVFERIPMRQYLLATAPSGKTYRWGEDEPYADRVFSDLADSSSVPGGCKELSCSLPRKPGVDYTDMVRGTRLELLGAAGRGIWTGELQQAPRSTGERIVMDPSAVGYQGDLAANESAQCIPIDSDMSVWGEPSAGYIAAEKANQINVNGQVSLLPAGDPKGEDIPSIDHAWEQLNAYTAGTGADIALSVYDSLGVTLGRIMLAFTQVAGGSSATWNDIVGAAADGLLSGSETLKDYNATTAPAESFFPKDAKTFLYLASFYSAAASLEGNWRHRYSGIKVFDRSGIPIYGTWPNVGVLASDVIAYVLAKWAPTLNFTTGSYGTLRPSSFVIPHLPFREPTSVKAIIEAALRFELLEWGVWPGQKGPTFCLNNRGEREGRKRWRVRAKECELKDNGPSMARSCNGVIIEYRDVDGSTKVIGPPGSGMQSTSEELIDRDPENPLNQIPGKRKWPKIAMKDVSTNLGAIERARRYIEQSKLLDGSGEATLKGTIEDDHGARYPYYAADAGDLLDSLDGRGDRYIVDANRSRSSRGTTVSLDAPPDSEEAMLERLNVEILAGGVN